MNLLSAWLNQIVNDDGVLASLLLLRSQQERIGIFEFESQEKDTLSVSFKIPPLKSLEEIKEELLKKVKPPSTTIEHCYGRNAEGRTIITKPITDDKPLAKKLVDEGKGKDNQGMMFASTGITNFPPFSTSKLFKGPDSFGIYEALCLPQKNPERQARPPLICIDCAVARRNDQEIEVFDLVRHSFRPGVELIFGKCDCQQGDVVAYFKSTSGIRQLNAKNEVRDLDGIAVYPKYAWRAGDDLVLFKGENHKPVYYRWSELEQGRDDCYSLDPTEGHSLADLIVEEKTKSLTALYQATGETAAELGRIREYHFDEETCAFTKEAPLDLIKLKLPPEMIEGNMKMTWHSIARFKNGPLVVAGLVTDGMSKSHHVVGSIEMKSNHPVKQSYIRKDAMRAPNYISYAIERFLDMPDKNGNYLVALSSHRYVHVFAWKERSGFHQLETLLINADPIDSDKRLGGGIVVSNNEDPTKIIIYFATVGKIIKTPFVLH